MIRFGFLILIFSVCWEFVSSQKPCDGVLGQQFRPHPTDCRVYYLCGQGKDWRLQCGPNMIWNQEKGACVLSTPKDTCTQNIKDPLPPKPPQGDPNARTPGTRHYSPFSESTWRPKCRPGSTKRFPHPTRCAQYYDCGADPKEDWWGKHLRECRYPTLYDTRTGSCEYYSTVNCGKREMPLDPCDYLSNACRNAHCAPCHIRYATCSGLPNGVNVWRGREKTPFYVICENERVSFHGQCTNREPGKREVYDGEYHTCGRPIDFEMGLVHHMHRGEIGKSQIVKEIHHAKQVQQSQQSKAPQRSNSPSNPVQANKNQRNQHSNANNNAAKKPTQQANKKHINQPNNNQAPQQNVKVQNANNKQPPKQPNTPKPHINQPQNPNNQQRHTAAPSSNTAAAAAAQNQPNAHAPHINQPKVPPPQTNANPPSKPAQTQTPGQNSQHVNQPQIQAPVHNSPPTQQQYQPPPQSHNTPQHPPNQHEPSNPQQQHTPPQRPPQNYGPPNNGPPHNQHVPQQPPQQYNHPNRQHNPPQPPQQNYGPPNRPPPQHQRPGSNGAAQPHVNQPQAPAQRQGPPYSHPPNQNKVPPQNPTSLQTFIGEIQNKFMNQQSNVPQTQAHPNHSQQPRHNAPPQHPSANKPSVPYQQAIRSKPRRGRRPQRKHNNQPGQPLPRQPVVHQPAPVVHKPAPVAHQPPPTRQASYPHPNQQRQPSYPQAPKVKPLPPVPQRPPVVPRNGPNHSAPIPRPPLNVNRRTVQNPNIPRAGPYQNSKPPYPIPNKHHGPPQPIPTQSRIYPQPPPRARTHGPQPVQKPRIGPYPKPQLYNEPSTIRQAIGSKRGGKNLSRRRLPQPTNQGKITRRLPRRRVPKRRA